MTQAASYDRFTALLNAAVDGIFIINEVGIIEVINPAVERLFGYTQAEMINQNISFLMPSPDREHHDSYLKNYLTTGNEKIIGIGREVQAQTKDGSIIQIHLSVGLFQKQQDIKFVGIIKDLSDLKNSESNLTNARHEIHELINRLAHVSRVGVMGEMAASIAHEVNQPLTAISTYANASISLLKSDKDNADEVITALEKISKQALRAGDIIRSLRTWINEKDTQREKSDCNALLKEVIDIVQIEANNRDITLQVNLESESHAIICDPIQIQQVAMNLIKNAIDALSDNSHQNNTNAPVIQISTQLIADGRIQLHVSDNGPGISETDSEKLFMPFYSTKETGMGMGLSICKTIIQAHGGELYYEQNLDQGVSFYCTLPTSVESK